jgi:hypothetical protein
MSEFAHCVLGDTRGEWETDRSETVRELALAMASQAQRTLDIVSRHLDPPLYNTGPFVEAVKELALRGRHSRIRLLVIDPAPLVAGGHRLLELAQRLSTFISLRVPGPDHRQFNEAWLIADSTGYIRRLFSDRYEGTASFADRRYARELTHEFDNLWQHAEPDPNLRRLHL